MSVSKNEQIVRDEIDIVSKSTLSEETKAKVIDYLSTLQDEAKYGTNDEQFLMRADILSKAAQASNELFPEERVIVKKYLSEVVKKKRGTK